METIETGPFFMRATCRTCHGRREIISKPCYECAGKGKTIQKKFTTIPIPAGKDFFRMKLFTDFSFLRCGRWTSYES
jgi:DnaJ-class molecular chaperone